MNKNSHEKLIKLTECAIMLALSIVLSFITIIKMPMGGEVTLLSMLPIMLIAIKYGTPTGLVTALVYSLFQLAQGFASGNVFVYCTTAKTVIICILFDYIVAFSVLGLAGLFRKKSIKKMKYAGIYGGIIMTVALRFVCHFITGFTIWGQWCGEEGPYVYSLIYNGTYLLPECIFTVLAAVILLRIPQIKKLLRLN